MPALLPIFCCLLALLTSTTFGKTTVYQDSLPLYQKRENTLIRYSKKYEKKIGKKFRSLRWPIPKVTVKTKDTVYALTHAKYYYSLKKRLPITKINFKKAFFRQYDPGYRYRYRRSFQNLEDLVSGYKDYRLNRKLLQGLARKYPKLVTYKILGKSRLGRKIPAIRITSRKKPKNIAKITVLFNGSHHSNELISTEHCYDIIYQILKFPKKYKRILRYMEIWVIPIVNPDGSYFFWNRSLLMGRKNGYLAPKQKKSSLYRGVDLNRNYPFKWRTGQKRASSGYVGSVFYRGPKPGSEPETQALMHLAEAKRFLFSISFHSYATCILFPYTIEEVRNPKPHYVKDLSERLAKRAVSTRPDKRFVAKKNIYPVDGTDQDYFYFQHGTNALLLESSHHNPNYPNAKAVIEGVREVWQSILQEYFTGNKLILKICDEEGFPIQASVGIAEIQTFESENHTSNPKNGMFYKMVLEKGSYNIQLKAEGYYPKEIFLHSQTSLQPQKIVMDKIKDIL